MTGLEIGLISVGVIVALIYAGMHVAVALSLVSFVSVWIQNGDAFLAAKLLTLAAADLMLENMSILDGQASTLRGERAKLMSQLQATPGVRAFESAANFILFRVSSADAVFAGLKQRGVLIKNVAATHPLLTGCLRVTVGTTVENETFIKALKATLGSLQS